MKQYQQTKSNGGIPTTHADVGYIKHLHKHTSPKNEWLIFSFGSSSNEIDVERVNSPLLHIIQPATTYYTSVSWHEPYREYFPSVSFPPPLFLTLSPKSLCVKMYQFRLICFNQYWRTRLMRWLLVSWLYWCYVLFCWPSRMYWMKLYYIVSCR